MTGICLSFVLTFTTGMAFADSGSDKPISSEGSSGSGIAGSMPAQEPIKAEVLARQQEIDKIVEQNFDKMVDMGFKVVYTAPVGDTIEIGISPYSKEYVQYLDALTGSGNINIVASDDIALMSVSSSPVNTAPDKMDIDPNTSTDGNVVDPKMYKGDVDTTDAVADRDDIMTIQGDVAENGDQIKTLEAPNGTDEELMYTTTVAPQDDSASKPVSTLLITVGSAAVVVLLGATALVIRKRRVATR